MSNIPPYQMGSPDMQPPRKPGTPGWVWGVVALGAIIFCCGGGAAVLVPVFAQAKQAAQARVSLNNAKQVFLSFSMYMNDNDERFPPFDKGFEVGPALHPYMKNPEFEAKARQYDWNTALSGIDFRTIENKPSVWIFTTNEQPTFLKVGVAFADYHAKLVRRTELDSVRAVKPIISKTKK